MEHGKLKILLCDDEKKYLEDLLEKVQEYMRSRSIEAELVTAPSAESVLKQNGFFCDIAFLDIEMRSLDGIALAKALRERNEHVIIFFVTAYTEYQDDVMDFQAFRFYEKPVSPERLYAGLDKAMRYMDNLFVDMYVKTDGCVKRLYIDDILLVKTEGRELRVVTENTVYCLRGKMDEWEKKLDMPYFCRVHKSFLINMHHICQYSYKEVVMINGEHVPIPSRKQATFHQVWFEYLRGKV